MSEILAQVLIVSSKHDFSTDHVVFCLREKSVPYVRVNWDTLSSIDIAFSPDCSSLIGDFGTFTFMITPSVLRSILFRAPVFLREPQGRRLTPDQQLSRGQWAAFIRSLTVFDHIGWINHPQATYQAEIKPYQLFVAKKMGFDVPGTLITNSIRQAEQFAAGRSHVIVKSLDPAILRAEGEEGFVYSNLLVPSQILNEDISLAPVVIQEALEPKIDIRVTVVDDVVVAVSITEAGLELLTK